jgi:hypothetical protein
MSLQYSHLLIPDRVDFAPQAMQVVAFLERLATLGSAPEGATFKIGRLSGTIRNGFNPRTGKEVFIPRRDFTLFENLAALRDLLVGLGDYDVLISGQRPAAHPPFRLYTSQDSERCEFIGKYWYGVCCCLRESSLPVKYLPLAVLANRKD